MQGTPMSFITSSRKSHIFLSHTYLMMSKVKLRVLNRSEVFLSRSFSDEDDVPGTEGYFAKSMLEHGIGYTKLFPIFFSKNCFLVD